MLIADDLEPLAVPIDTLRPLDGNPRRGDVDVIERSLRKFGQRKPIVVTNDGEIVAGNHTYEAACRLGAERIAVTRISDEHAKAYALADNRTAELGTYDNEALAALIADVAGVDADLLAATGWTDADLAKLLEPATTRDGGDQSDQLTSVFAVVLTCRDEAQQLELVREFMSRGIECRAIFG